MQLQRLAGNHAVSGLVFTQRRRNQGGDAVAPVQRSGHGCAGECGDYALDVSTSGGPNLQRRGGQPCGHSGPAATHNAAQEAFDGGALGQSGREEDMTTVRSAGGAVVSRQIVTTPGTPNGSGGCSDLLQAIIDLLNEVAQRYNDALNDPHNLFNNHRRVQDAHPDYGSWDGHRDRYYYDRDRLRQKLSEWEIDDDCRGYPLSKQQQEELQEAEEFRNKRFPERPAPSMSRSHEEAGESVWDKLRKYLPEILVGALIAIAAIAAAVAIAACFASGACEFGLALAGLGILVAAGIAAALRAAGVRDEPSGEPMASNDQQFRSEDLAA
ncbi:MAG: hypothetical protein QOI86_4292 [Actinomycetota bacterium]|jgi:hypothetical protein|nr:hypothetical protein [Actinomycetota bacterium]